MEEKRNLKNGTGKLLYYRYKDSGLAEDVVRKTDGGKEQRYKIKVKERVYFDEEVVRKFSLERLRTPLPRVHGHFTSIDNYFFDYWGYFLGCEATALFAHLLRYTMSKDYCYPDMGLIALKMGKTVKTIRSYMDKLEEYGFIYRFWVQNPERNNVDEAPIIKVRKTIPLLSEDLIKKLPDRLREEHNKYLENLMESYDIQLKQEESVNKAYNNLMIHGKVIHSKNTAEKIRKLMGSNLDIRVSSKDQVMWNGVLNIMQERISKPSFDTWFTDTAAEFKDKDTMIVYTTNEFTKTHLEATFDTLLKDILKNLYGKEFNIEYKVIEQA